MKELLRDSILEAVAALAASGALPAGAPPAFVVERTKSRDHGDFATNIAMMLAKSAGKKPRDIAQAIVGALPARDGIAKVEIAGPGFINFFLSRAAYQHEIGEVLAKGDAYGRGEGGAGRMAGVEFVSANPTGPLHVGHGRAAVIGDCIARALDANGWKVVREFYYNDAGAQIMNLALSVQARCRDIEPDADD